MSEVAKIIVQPGRNISGCVRVPGDKSISHRALMLGALAEGQTLIYGFLAGEDCLATLCALRALGVQIDDSDRKLIKVAGVGLKGLRPSAGPLDMGNSGTGLRLLAGVLAGQSFNSELTGDESLLKRPMERIAKPLRRMGAEIETTDGCPPVHIRGESLHPIVFQSPVASAQVKSAVLLAGLYADGTTRVQEPAVTRDHTERMLQTFGVQVQSGDLLSEVKGPAKLTACEVHVPGDLSSAAFVLAAGCLSQSDGVSIESVGINPTRIGVIEILRLMGADINIEAPSIESGEPVATVSALPSSLQGVVIPAELVPLAIDELPLIFALAACAEGETIIRGAEELRHKESDRIAIMVSNLLALGVEVEEFPDGVRIVGGQLQGGTVNSAGDHRIAMAFAVVAMCATQPITILDTDNVATSFPDFVTLMQSLGLRVTDA
ncbi:MAG: 3-phosphoshikimate 1-carboxyvinyltransferase [Gammaproteobacteria bacterium]|nr:3-phosphoshikimate 1-carboxyvinyltransferase [Gammaproteobacteria bacterium]MCP4090870.1 3-phosphoshikimate 1-carboxyvinyltransferase [Gammaproteobacteria bacterium]MCP4275522.1 3-phosphoshikimate 1-carboxyvinyltransferase [Gammaproteobacteria bacterium]MCP4832244.1 3-phosphoshikimate 1-carboxyvinyltransferase [Gammaproteobacteria bacterium]MCP4930298.1 3-phosphoshikimate 1-carboxyvinyltransferase [Gammaproteobacteria bacterium]